jgi:carbonic anhydrase
MCVLRIRIFVVRERVHFLHANVDSSLSSLVLVLKPFVENCSHINLKANFPRKKNENIQHRILH